MSKNTHPTLGFSLFELAISLVILSFLAGGGFAIAARKTTSENDAETRRRMAIITHAIQQYVSANGYLPCPGNATETATNATRLGFARLENAGTLCPDAVFTNGASGVVSGAVPIANLGLPAHYMLDGWNRKFTYVIDRDLTRRTATPWWGNYLGSTVPLVTANNSQVYIINDQTTNNTIVGPVATANNTAPDFGMNATDNSFAFILLSHGSNGHGAWRARGGLNQITAANRGRFECENDPQDVQTALNCDTTPPSAPNPAVPLPTGADGVFRLAPFRTQGNNDYYDDILAFCTKTQLNGNNCKYLP